MTKKTVEQLQEKIGYQFTNQDLLRDALTHSSTATDYSYERLEFLGDRVLGLVISHFLFQKFSNESEGDLAKRLSSLVQGSTLAEISEKIELGDYIHFSDSERAAGGANNENILADVFEALIGALFLDQGLSSCETLIRDLWSDVLTTMKEPPQHPKTALQEWAQSAGLPLPVYEITGQSGPDHAPVFDVTLSVKGYDHIVTQGRSRQEAEREAAHQFMEQVTSSS